MITFDEHIAPNFARYVGAMKKVRTSTPQGTVPFDMSNYDFVKSQAKKMLVRLRGVNSEGQAVPIMPPNSTNPNVSLRDQENAELHNYRLKSIELLERWIADGMPKNAPVV